MCQYSYRSGLHFLETFGGGQLLPQVYARSLAPDRSSITFTDDVIFASNRQGIFQLVILLESADEIGPTIQQVRSLDIDRLSCGFVKHSESVIIVQNLTATLSKPQEKEMIGEDFQIIRVASAAEFAVSHLCENRPEPRYYDPFRMKDEVHGKKFVIVRPDRFIFASSANTKDLCNILQLIEPTLRGAKSSASTLIAA